MLEFLQNNWGSFAVGAVVLAVIVLIVMKLVRDKRQADTPAAGTAVPAEHAAATAPAARSAPTQLRLNRLKRKVKRGRTMLTYAQKSTCLRYTASE